MAGNGRILCPKLDFKGANERCLVLTGYAVWTQHILLAILNGYGDLHIAIKTSLACTSINNYCVVIGDELLIIYLICKHIMDYTTTFMA